MDDTMERAASSGAPEPTRASFARALQARHVRALLEEAEALAPDAPEVATIRTMLARLQAYPDHRRKAPPYGVRAAAAFSALHARHARLTM